MNATKASGFRGARDDKWWTKDSKYGVKYQCSDCGKITLGTGNDSGMHWPTCPLASGEKRQRLVPRAQKSQKSSPLLALTVEVPAWNPKQVSQLLANVPNARRVL